jgi:hypothetical protein
VIKPISADSLVNEIKKDPYDFNPGEKMLYNNSGYFLLGYIISKVSGKPYDVYLKETFFDPLGMTNTGVHHTAIKLAHEAKGYSRNDAGFVESLNWDMSWAGGAGALYSTLDDLHKWNEALYGGKVLNAQSMKAALTPATLKEGNQPGMKYGYGLILSTFRGKEMIGHGGGLHGFVTQLAYVPAERLTIVMYSNTDEPEVNFNPNPIAEAFLWDKMDKQLQLVELQEKPKYLQQLAGRYNVPATGAVLAVTIENDRLFAQLGSQQKFEIFPASDTVFFWKVVEARVGFFRDASGAFNRIIIYQGGQELAGERLKEETIIKLSAEVLAQYLGKYKLNDQLTITVTAVNDKLYAEATGQSKVELKPLSSNEFTVQEINAKVVFEKSSAGKVEKMRLHMNGSNNELPKIE